MSQKWRPQVYTSLIACVLIFQQGGGCEIYLSCSVFVIYVPFLWGQHINQMPGFKSVNPEKKNKLFYSPRSWKENRSPSKIYNYYSALRHPVSVSHTDEDDQWQRREQAADQVLLPSCHVGKITSTCWWYIKKRTKRWMWPCIRECSVTGSSSSSCE